MEVPFVSVSAWQPVSRGNLQMHWIGDTPGADGVRILLPDGTALDFAFHPVDLAENQKNSADLLIYDASIFAQRDQPQDWAKIVAKPGGKAVLLEKSKIASNEAPLLFFTPAPASTAPDARKMIGTVDSGGGAKIYLLSHAVNGGDIFKLNDVYTSAFSVSGSSVVKTADVLDLAGPAAYVGRQFATAHSANDVITTGMFTPSRAPATAK